MASDWIKMRTDLYRDPKVSVIADVLLAETSALSGFVNQMCQRQMTVTRNVMRNVTVGALVSVWGVMRQRGKRVDADLVCSGVTLAVLDDIADLPGFGAAMAVAGWVVETPQGIEFPRFFDEYNVDPDDRLKSKNAERQRKFREKNKGESNDERNVTSNVTVTHREEKRREEEEENTYVASVPLPTAVTSPALPACPVEQVVELYHQVLPELPRVRLMPEARRKALQRRWRWVLTSRKGDGTPRACTADDAMGWMRSFFERARDNDFLMGRTGRGAGHEGWQCDLDHLLSDKGLKAVVEKTAVAA